MVLRILYARREGRSTGFVNMLYGGVSGKRGYMWSIIYHIMENRAVGRRRVVQRVFLPFPRDDDDDVWYD